MYISQVVSRVIKQAKELAVQLKHEYVMPEHVMIAMCDEPHFIEAFQNCGGNPQLLAHDLRKHLDQTMEESQHEPIESYGLQEAFMRAGKQVTNSGRDEIHLDHLLAGIMSLPESYCVYFIAQQGIELSQILYQLCHSEDGMGERGTNKEQDMDEPGETEDQENSEDNQIKKYITNLNELEKQIKEPFIGREDIIQRTIQILCRKKKNNPLHVGEPGVGKTTIVLGLAKKINEGKVPGPLKNAVIYELDLGAVMAGTAFRGEFEKRLKKIFDTLQKKENAIVYIDEIHNMVGAGAIGKGSLDASSLLKPYLTNGRMKCIGTTTYEECKKYLERDKALIRRFQKIEVKEPEIDEAVQILMGIKDDYEAYHHIQYTDEAIEAAVKLSKQYINDKFLPDKAIDLIDEAGAYYRANELEGIIDVPVIEATLSKICKIPKSEIEKNEKKLLLNLEEQLKHQVFGQDKAVEEIVRCIKLSRSGLGDENKPVASLLFVGPTGVGKTELAKSVAKDLGIKMVRFDMSEYAEQYTVSKLIGTPPGYIGYEEGGLLTDEIRKNPYCVLLLDEIEKAHSDIYNVLLQIMDYATLTDNQGRKADFRNVILIMTSNAGAAKIGKRLAGFGERTIDQEAVGEAVKKTFTPEFRNRLTRIITFNHVDEKMAELIVERQLQEFADKLISKNIQISFSDDVKAYIVKKGVSAEYGAREINRLIEGELKAALVDEILFGSLSNGGKCQMDIDDEKFVANVLI